MNFRNPFNIRWVTIFSSCEPLGRVDVDRARGNLISQTIGISRKFTALFLLSVHRKYFHYCWPCTCTHVLVVFTVLEQFLLFWFKYSIAYIFNKIFHSILSASLRPRHLGSLREFSGGFPISLHFQISIPLAIWGRTTLDVLPLKYKNNYFFISISTWFPLLTVVLATTTTTTTIIIIITIITVSIITTTRVILLEDDNK